MYRPSSAGGGSAFFFKIRRIRRVDWCNLPKAVFLEAAGGLSYHKFWYFRLIGSGHTVRFATARPDSAGQVRRCVRPRGPTYKNGVSLKIDFSTTFPKKIWGHPHTSPCDVPVPHWWSGAQVWFDAFPSWANAADYFFFPLHDKNAVSIHRKGKSQTQRGFSRSGVR